MHNVSFKRHLCEQRVDGEETVYLFVGKIWVSVRQCLKESSTGHVQSYTMCTFWIVAFWTPDAWRHFMLPVETELPYKAGHRPVYVTAQ